MTYPTTPGGPYTHPTLPESAEQNVRVFNTAWGVYHRHILECSARHADFPNANEITLKIMILKKNTPTTEHPQVDSDGFLLPYGDDVAKLIESDVLPQMGETLDVAFPDRVGKMWEGEARLREYNLACGPIGSLIGEFHYTTLYQLAPIECPFSAGITDIGLRLPITFETTSSLRSISLYRKVDWAVNAPPRDLEASAADIGGVPISPVGSMNIRAQTGIPFDVPQMRIRIRMIKDTTFDQSDKVTTTQNLSSYIGRRNSETFIGFEKNTLWCEGVSCQQVDHNFYELVMDLVCDLYYEHSQVPGMEGDGQAIIDADGNFEEVYWTRPTRLDADFNDIFGDVSDRDLLSKEILEEGWWEYWSRASDGTSNASGVTTGLC